MVFSNRPCACVRALVASCLLLSLIFLRAAHAAPQKAEQRTIDVHVVGPDGKPVPATNIHAGVWTNDPFKSNRDYVCDTNGRATVELPGSFYILRLWAKKDGYVPLYAHWESGEIEADKNAIPKQFTFRLQKGATIGGVVKNEDGQPIAGAKIGATCRDEQDENQRVFTSYCLADGEESRVTDDRGRWTLNNVPKDAEEVLLSVTHPEYIGDLEWGGLQEMQKVTLQSLYQQTATIVMSRGISVTGTVTDPKGRPVAGTVVVWGDDPYSQTGRHQEHRQQVRTDALGVYRLPPLPPLTLTVTVIAEGWAPDLKKVEITPAKHEANFQLKPGKKLRIRFFDESGKPIPEVFVQTTGWRDCKSLYNMKHPMVLETKIPDSADKNGIYEWTWAPEDAVEYYFGKQGYEEIENQPITADDKEHKIVLSQTKEDD
jgi:hypothetical protein